jgi:hypothetical protein
VDPIWTPAPTMQIKQNFLHEFVEARKRVNVLMMIMMTMMNENADNDNATYMREILVAEK